MRRVILPMLRPGAEPILSGRTDGEDERARLYQVLCAIGTPTLVFLNFRSVALATASYLDEVTLKLRTQLRNTPVSLVAANLSPKVLDEFEGLLHRANDSFLACKLSEDGDPLHSKILGTLDDKLKTTYDMIKMKGEISAKELHVQFGDIEKIGPTAWNNRLNTLADKGLVQEIPAGRMKKYRLTLEAD